MMLLLDLMNFTLRCLKSSAVATPESHLWHLKMASKMLFPIKIYQKFNQKHIKIWPDLAISTCRVAGSASAASSHNLGHQPLDGRLWTFGLLFIGISHVFNGFHTVFTGFHLIFDRFSIGFPPWSSPKHSPFKAFKGPKSRWGSPSAAVS